MSNQMYGGLPVHTFNPTREQVVALVRNYKDNLPPSGNATHAISRALNSSIHHFGTPTPRDMCDWCELCEQIQVLNKEPSASLPFLPHEARGLILEELRK